MQGFTSSATSVNKTKLPAVYKKAPLSAPIVFDYGAGKYTEHIEEFVKAPHRVYLPYDPYNLSETVNKFSVTMVLYAMHVRYPVDTVCSNVLNVIDNDETVQSIAKHIEEISSSTGGHGYVTVYEGNRSGIGKQTGKDSYQRNEPLRNYLRFFTKAKIQNGMIVVG